MQTPGITVSSFFDNRRSHTHTPPDYAGCHKPPVPDSEVVQIIKLFNAKQKKGDPDARLVWKCNTCVKGKAKAVHPQSHSSAPRPLGIKSTPQLLRPASSNPSDAIVIEDDDDDDIVILDKPPTPPAPVNRELAASSKRSRNIPVHERNQQVTFAPLPSITSSRDPKENNRSRVPGASASGDPAALQQHKKSIQIQSTSVPAKSSSHKEFITKKTTTVATRHDSGIDDPYIVSVTHSSDKQTTTEGDDVDDDPLEYLTPPQPPPAALPSLDPPRLPSPSEPSTLPTDVVSELTVKLVLLPAWISSRHSAPDAEPDLWERRRQARGHSNAKQRSVMSTSHNSGTKGEGFLPTSSRRKFKAQHLSSRTGKDVGQGATQTPFFFSVDEWMRLKV